MPISPSTALMLAPVFISACCPPAGWQALQVPDPRHGRSLPTGPAALLALADGALRDGPRDLRCLDRALAALNKAARLLEQGNPHRAGHGTPSIYDVRWRLAWGSFLLSEVLPAKEQRRGFAEKGADSARQAIAREPRRVEGHYYLAVNLGKLAELTGDLTLIKPAVAAAEQAQRLDERFDGAGPLVFLGKVYLSAPPWPVSVGSPDKAVPLLERALRLAPRPLTRVFLGEAYFEDEQYERAAQQLNQALDRPQLLPPRWRREAEAYLRRIRESSLREPDPSSLGRGRA